MIKLAALSLCCVFLAVILRERSRVFALSVSVLGACIIFYSTLSELRDIVSKLYGITDSISSAAPYIRLMLKVLGITLMTQLISDICRDNGENALASVIEISAKLIVVVLVLPLFEAIISIVGGILK